MNAHMFRAFADSATTRHLPASYATLLTLTSLRRCPWPLRLHFNLREGTQRDGHFRRLLPLFQQQAFLSVSSACCEPVRWLLGRLRMRRTIVLQYRLGIGPLALCCISGSGSRHYFGNFPGLEPSEANARTTTPVPASPPARASAGFFNLARALSASSAPFMENASTILHCLPEAV